MSTKRNRVLLLGNSPLCAEFRSLLEQKGYQVVCSLEDSDRTDVDFAMETSNYDLDEKRCNMVKLDQVCARNIPILTTTLAVTGTEIASWTQYPNRVVGFGTFSPLLERKLLEIAPALQTEREVLASAVTLFSSLGKDVEIVDDEVGLVFPRILSLIINEAVFTLMEGTASVEEIDIAMKKGTNYPYGPLEWADRIGLPEVYAVIRGLHQNLGEERYRPAPLLRKMVLAGWHGAMSPRGFYQYT